QPRLTHRHGRPHPRRPLPTTPRTIMTATQSDRKVTHSNISRADQTRTITKPKTVIDIAHDITNPHFRFLAQFYVWGH
ncbi:MAG: hypothetical protein WCF33_07105, partial [Pseudonocardiaceae bacterium]